MYDLGTLLDVLDGAPAWAPTILLALAALVFRPKAPERRPRPARPRPRLSSESGSILVEVLVGAVLLAMATTALLNGIDGAQKTGGRNKARTVAATLAEQDQERMRGLAPETLVGLIGTPTTRTVKVRDVNYTVVSSSSWAVDASSNGISCSSASKTAANLRIVSTVSSALTRGNVVESSLVSPGPGTFADGEGTVGVQVLDRDGHPVQGVSVSLTGTNSYLATTNDLGCAVFPFIDVGDYDISATHSSDVGWQGESPVTGSVSAIQGQTTTAGLVMDSPAGINASFQTVVNGTTVSNQKTRWITVGNAKLDPPYTKTKTLAAGDATTVGITGLFPFSDGYGVWGGACDANNPTLYGASPSAVPVTPGSTATVSTVRLPSINLVVYQVNGTTVQSNATVTVKSADSGCTQTFPTQLSSSTGVLPLPGYPYGKYTICAFSGTRFGRADIRASGAWDSRQTTTVATETSTNKIDDTVINTAAAGNTTSQTTNGAIKIQLNRQTSTGAVCP